MLDSTMKKVLIVVVGLAWGYAGMVRAASPYPASPVIAGITFDRTTLVKAAPGSDQFYRTWASDDNIYLAWGDGGGFGGTNSLGRASLGVARIAGMPPAWTPTNVWGGVGPLSGQTTVAGKARMLAIGNALYLFAVKQSSWDFTRIIKSTDNGMTWTVGSFDFEFPLHFMTPIQFGKAYAGARDSYVYFFFNPVVSSSNGTTLGLTRVLTTNVETRSAYEFFSGFDGSGNSTWTADVNSHQAVFTDPNGVEWWGFTCEYHAALNRYLLMVRHNGKTGQFGIFDAPEPWGPWTTVGYENDFPTWVYTPDPNGASGGRPAFVHQFPAKWRSADGLTLWHISDRGDQFNIMKATLSLNITDTTPPTAQGTAKGGGASSARETNRGPARHE